MNENVLRRDKRKDDESKASERLKNFRDIFTETLRVFITKRKRNFYDQTFIVTIRSISTLIWYHCTQSAHTRSNETMPIFVSQHFWLISRYRYIIVYILDNYRYSYCYNLYVTRMCIFLTLRNRTSKGYTIDKKKRLWASIDNALNMTFLRFVYLLRMIFQRS